MSKFVSEIIDSIKAEPDTWKNYKGWGVEKDGICVWGAGNTWILSIIGVRIGEHDQPISKMDKIRLEIAIKRWYRTGDLKRISN